MPCSCCGSTNGRLDLDETITEDIITNQISEIALVKKKEGSSFFGCIKHYALRIHVRTRAALKIIGMDWRKGKDGPKLNVVDWTSKPEIQQSYVNVCHLKLRGLRKITIFTMRDFYNAGASKCDNCMIAARRMFDSAKAKDTDNPSGENDSKSELTLVTAPSHHRKKLSQIATIGQPRPVYHQRQGCHAVSQRQGCQASVSQRQGCHAGVSQRQVYQAVSQRQGCQAVSANGAFYWKVLKAFFDPCLI